MSAKAYFIMSITHYKKVQSASFITCTKRDVFRYRQRGHYWLFLFSVTFSRSRSSFFRNHHTLIFSPLNKKVPRDCFYSFQIIKNCQWLTWDKVFFHAFPDFWRIVIIEQNLSSLGYTPSLCVLVSQKSTAYRFLRHAQCSLQLPWSKVHQTYRESSPQRDLPNVIPTWEQGQPQAHPAARTVFKERNSNAVTFEL